MNDLNLENLIKLMQFRPTLTDTAAWFNVSEDTVERKIKKLEKITFRQFKAKYSSNIKYKLMDKAIDMAMTGNTTMMIFTLKNMCSWSDKINTEQNSDTQNQFYIKYSDQKTTDFPEGAKVFSLNYSDDDLKKPLSSV